MTHKTEQLLDWILDMDCSQPIDEHEVYQRTLRLILQNIFSKTEDQQLLILDGVDSSYAIAETALVNAIWRMEWALAPDNSSFTSWVIEPEQIANYLDAHGVSLLSLLDDVAAVLDVIRYPDTRLYLSEKIPVLESGQ
jgi:hypothetical protein